MYNTIDNLDPARWVPSPSHEGPSLLAALRQRFARLARREAPDDALVDLDPHTLADIGAPEHLLDRAMARRELQRQERDGLRIGLAAGAWHHW